MNRVLTCLGTSSSPTEQEKSPNIVLGSKYEGIQEMDTFLNNIYSKYYFTYRFDFYPIPLHPSQQGEPIASDVGWGCMHRSGQMILANSLLFLLAGKSM